jgi:hypothetical protein
MTQRVVKALPPTVISRWRPIQQGKSEPIPTYGPKTGTERLRDTTKSDILPKGFDEYLRLLKAAAVLDNGKINIDRKSGLLASLLPGLGREVVNALPRGLLTWIVEDFSAKLERERRQRRKRKSKKPFTAMFVVIDLFFRALKLSIKKDRYLRSSLNGKQRKYRYVKRAVRGVLKTQAFVIATARRSGIKGLIALAKFWSYQSVELFAGKRNLSKHPQFKDLPSLFGCHLSKRFLATFYGLSRSINVGANPTNLLEEYEKTMTTPSKEVSQATLNDLSRFIERLVTKVKPRIRKIWDVDDKGKRRGRVDLADLNARSSVATTACIERSVAKGGARSYIRDVMTTSHSGVGESPHTALGKALRWTHTTKQVLSFNRVEWSQASPDGKEIPWMIPTAVPKPGGGSRIVSVCNASLVNVLQPINELLLRIVEKVPECMSNLMGTDPAKALRVLNIGSEECIFYSADLTAASDHIPHSVARVVVDAILRSLGVDQSDPLSKWFKLAIGPFRIVRRTGPASCVRTKIVTTNLVTQRGLLMGLGITWPILNLLNVYCSRRSRGQEMVQKDTLIAGDDLLGFWKRKRISRYERHLKALDLRLNKGKTLCSSRVGIFTENLIQVSRSGRPKIFDVDASDFLNFNTYGRIYLSQVSLAKRINVSGRPIDQTLPVWRTIGTSIGNIFESKIPMWQKLRAGGVMKSLHIGAIRKLAYAKIPLELPHCLGGAGAPIMNRRPTLTERLSGSILLSSNDRITRTRAMSVLSDFWRNSYISEPVGLGRIQDEVIHLPTAHHKAAQSRSDLLQSATGRLMALSSLEMVSSVPERTRLGKHQSIWRYGRFAERYRRYLRNRASKRHAASNDAIRRLYTVEKLDWNEKVRKKDANALLNTIPMPSVRLVTRNTKSGADSSASHNLAFGPRTAVYYQARQSTLEAIAKLSRVQISQSQRIERKELIVQSSSKLKKSSAPIYISDEKLFYEMKGKTPNVELALSEVTTQVPKSATFSPKKVWLRTAGARIKKTDQQMPLINPPLELVTSAPSEERPQSRWVPSEVPGGWDETSPSLFDIEPEVRKVNREMKYEEEEEVKEPPRKKTPSELLTSELNPIREWDRDKLGYDYEQITVGKDTRTAAEYEAAKQKVLALRALKAQRKLQKEKQTSPALSTSDKSSEI